MGNKLPILQLWKRLERMTDTEIDVSDMGYQTRINAILRVYMQAMKSR